MPDRADAHMHLFSPGYVDLLPENCRRLAPDEITLYEALRARAGVTQSLVIGYEGLPAYAGNNDYIALLAQSREWIRPAAFCADASRLTIEQLERLRARRFVGLSMYMFDASILAGMQTVSDSVWKWLVDHRWLISVNSRAPYFDAWQSILDRWPELRVVISHFGLPVAQSHEISFEEARDVMRPVLSLAGFPGVHLKASAFYALAAPSFAYPHRPAWRFVECALQAFGSQRLMWGSDFSPALEHLSYVQTYALFDEMPFLNDVQRNQICGQNLLRLLDDVG